MRQFRPEDTSPWFDRYGPGNGGAKHVTTNETYDGANAGLVGAYTVDPTVQHPTINLDAASTFADGMLVRIHQSRGPILTSWDRNWEWNKIRSGGGTTTIVLEYPLDLPYQDDGSGAANQAQITEAKSYASLLIDATKSLSPNAWDGNKGGDLPIFVVGLAEGPGKLNTANLGFRGGAQVSNHQTYNGEGWPGDGNDNGGINYLNNGNGGGAGTRTPQNNGNSGAGSAGKSTASNGPQHNEFSLDSGNIARGGVAFGDAYCKLAVFSGGSGGGGHDDGGGSTVGDGVNGSGFLTIFAGSIASTLELSSNGQDSVRNPDNHNGAGGGSAAGPIIAVSEAVASSSIHASHGAGEWGCAVQHSNKASDGTDGFIFVGYGKTNTSTVTPSAQTQQAELWTTLYAHEGIFSSVNGALQQEKYKRQMKVVAI